MNKKLLLSFAVFATVLSVNAQKSMRKAERTANYAINEVSFKSEVNLGNPKVTKKRGGQTITDTLGYIAYKRTYGSPKTSGIYVTPYYEADSVELMSVSQDFKNNSTLNFKSLAATMVSLNPNGATVDVKIYDENYNELARVTKDVAYSASSLTTYWFDLSQSVEIKGDFMVSIEPNDVKDSIYLSTTGSYGRNTSATASITGTTLTTTAFSLGTSFLTGQEISGTGITPGTKIVARTGQNTYTVSIAQEVTSTTVLGKNYSYGSVDALFTGAKFPYASGTQDPDFSKTPKFGQYVLYWDGVNNKPYEADLYLFPVVEYTWNSEVDIDNKCLGTSKTVNVTYKNQDAFNIVQNPLLNKMAFWGKYLGRDKTTGYFYSRAYSSNNAELRDTLDFNTTSFAYKFDEVADDMNDTITVYDFLLPYGYMVTPATKYFGNQFFLSSKMSATTSVLAPAHINTNDGSVVVTATGGYAPYTYAWDNNETNDTINVGVGTYNVVVTDANGCSAASASAVVELSSVAELGLTNVVVYPNPVKEVLNVKFDSKTAATVELVNVAGQVLDSKTSSNVSFNTANLGAGVYFVNIKVAEGVYTQKIIKD
jgi:hypothetical protein